MTATVSVNPDAMPLHSPDSPDSPDAVSTADGPWFAGLEPVTLPELNAVAAFQTRVDRKYLLDRNDLGAIFAEVGPGVRVLDVDGRQCFGYESTYFDTPGLDSYLDAVRSRPNRFKVRTRTYLDTADHVVEVKTRCRGLATVKASQPGTPAEHLALSEASQTFVDDVLQRNLLRRPPAGNRATIASLVPVVRTHYRRSTLLVAPEPASDAPSTPPPSRATIDTSLVFAGADGPWRFQSNLAVVETKTTGPPSMIDKLLWASGQRPVKLSKFGAGLALLRPELPAAKWNRVLRNHFGWRPQRPGRGLVRC